MTRRMTMVLVAALVLAALPAVTLAQPAASGDDCGGHGKAGMKMGRGAGMGLAGLKLTEEQVKKFDGLRDEHVKATVGMRADIEVKQVELAALWRAEKLDAKKIVAKVKEVSGLREKLAVARASQRLTLYDLLTPEQREQFRAGFGEGGRRGRGMMRGKGAGREMMHGAGRRGGCDDCGDRPRHKAAPDKK
ncbi:MAG: Spy/CpxP family protein refolding chaperone [bacterium]